MADSSLLDLLPEDGALAAGDPERPELAPTTFDLSPKRPHHEPRARAMISMFMGGGPSHLDLFDLKPGAPEEIRGPFKPIRTAVPGLEIADLYPQTAEVIGRLSVVRSLVSKEGDHERGTYHLKTGYRPDPSVRHPSLG